MANLIEAFEYYLLATFLLGALQVRTYVAMMRFVLGVPGRWPRLYELLRENLRALLTWPVVIVGSFTVGLWTLHTVLRRLVWPQAHVEWADLTAHTAWLSMAGFCGFAMVALDGWALLRVVRFEPPRMQWLLDLTELGLSSGRLGGALRLLVGWQIRTRLVRRLPILVQWSLRRTAEVGARLLFGLSLWLGWALGYAGEG